LKIVQTELLKNCGVPSESEEWLKIRRVIIRSIERIHWPADSKTFIIHPESGKKSGMGNGVKPIKDGFVRALQTRRWKPEIKVITTGGLSLGSFDAAYQASFGLCVVEWETGNISSSHRSLNKMSMLLAQGLIAVGMLVVPSRKLYKYLTDRVGNFQELEPYLDFWRSVPCTSGVLEIIVVEQDGESVNVPRIPKGTDGRALI